MPDGAVSPTGIMAEDGATAVNIEVDNTAEVELVDVETSGSASASVAPEPVPADALDKADGEEKSVEPVVIPRSTRTLTIAPGPKVLLEWRDIHLKVNLKKKQVHKHDPSVRKLDSGRFEKHILNSVSGFVRPGELVAVMGASGAGKSSLLNVLARRNTHNTGEVLINGSPFTKEHLPLSAYVQQEDLLMGNLTVREHLRFQARLRMDKNLSTAEKYAHVERLINMLSLHKCSDQRIGALQQNLSRGISGGERKRLAFATEILTDPPLLFADEPTSGLDSFMAESVVQMMQQLARNGRAVVATIHQPSSEVYNLFDRVCLLSEGRVVYFGSREEAIPHFAKLGYPCPTFSNPADYFINILAIAPSDESEEMKRDAYYTEEHKRIGGLADVWSKTHPKGLRLDDEDRNRIINSDDAAVAGSRQIAKSSCGSQFSVLVERSFKDEIRDAILTRARAGQAIVLGLLVGLMYFRLDNDQASVQNKMGAIFFLLINQAMSGTFGVLQTFPLERPIMQREHESGNYSLLTYYMAKVVASLPSQIVFPSLFCLVGYWMMGIRDDVGVFLAFVGVVLLVTNAAMSMGYAISSATSSVSVALAVGPVMLLPFMLFGGFFMNADSVPVYFSWLESISFFKYGFEALAVLVWRDWDIDGCNPGMRCFENGDQVLKSFAFDRDNLALDIWVLAGMVVAFRIIAFIALWLQTRSKQNE